MTTPERHDLVVIGGSAGGVDALKRFVDRLPADLPATVCVALHMASGSPSLLPSILARRAGIAVEAAVDGAPLRPGVVLVAQPDTHLVVCADTVRLGTGPRENNHRPSIDALLRSAAVSHGPRVIGVVLTGMLDDGSAGLRTVLSYGGEALVQDPGEAMFPSMPRNALAAAPGSRSLPLDALVDEVVRLVGTPPGPASGAGPREAERTAHEAEVRSALGESPALPDGSPVGRPSPYSCPDCGGVLRIVEDSGALRFRCRVGHAYSATSLVDLQGATVEDALWTAVRALEERAEMTGRLSGQAERSHSHGSAGHFRRRADQAQQAARLLRTLVAEQQRVDTEDDTASRPAAGA